MVKNSTGITTWKDGTSDCDHWLSVSHGMGKKATSLFSFLLLQSNLVFFLILLWCKLAGSSGTVFLFSEQKMLGKLQCIYFIMKSWPAKILNWIKEAKLTGNLLIFNKRLMKNVCHQKD